MHRSAPRLARILACAAVPVMLVVAGCSSDSGSDSTKDSGTDSSSSATSRRRSPSPTVAPAKYATLPSRASRSPRRRSTKLVPKAKAKAGTAASRTTTEPAAAAPGTAWTTTASRAPSTAGSTSPSSASSRTPSLGVSGDKRAEDSTTPSRSPDAQATEGAKNVRDRARRRASASRRRRSRYDLKKNGEDFSTRRSWPASRTSSITLDLQRRRATRAPSPRTPPKLMQGRDGGGQGGRQPRWAPRNK